MSYFFAAAVTAAFLYVLFRKRRRLPRHRRHLVTYLLAGSAIILTLAMVRYPQEAFEASVAGLEVWWHIVFPALLPFFVFAQILIGLGVVHMMGVFLEPVMRPVFNVPGTGSFVMAMGLASGFPIGAILTSELRRRNLCNRVEAERLLSFTNTADPLFMFGAVAVGMLGYPQIGVTLAAAHYLSSLTLGLIMRFYRHRETGSAEPASQRRQGGLISRALNALVEARQKDGRPIGQLLGDAIRKSVDTLMLIGGFIILFSVIIRIMDVMGIVAMFSQGLVPILRLVGLNPQLASALFSGIVEIDLGCQYTALLAEVSLRDKLIASSMIIAWSGLSVHGQVASIVSGTDIRISPYIAARFVHAILAGIYTALLFGPFAKTAESTVIPVLLQTIPRSTPGFWWSRTAFMFNHVLLLLGLLAVAAVLCYAVRFTRFAFFISRRHS